MPKAKPSRAFTLVEILVSIAIIGVLISILSPVLASVRRKAGSLVCTTHLAGIGAAAVSYASDHRGELPTFDFPKYADGFAEPIPVPAWVNDGGWVILPFSETTFWAYQLREYVNDSPDANYLQTVESLTCPVAFRDWKNELEQQLLEDHNKINPMWPTQKSYMKSIALFTAPSAWTNRNSPPNVNRVHQAIKVSTVRTPAAKTFLVERTSFHDHQRVDLVNRPAGARFNLLAVDGHVTIKRPENATKPHGFIAAGTGLEYPLVEPNRWREEGILYISTHRGALGNDW